MSIHLFLLLKIAGVFNKMNKQNGNTTIIFIIILFIGLIALQRFTRPELYDDSNDFQKNKIVNSKVTARIEYLKWYDDDDITNYYIFTNIGKLHIDAKGYGTFYGDEKMYDELEDYVGQFCTFNVEQNILYGTQATDFYSCEFRE